jgi:hypothetical protein
VELLYVFWSELELYANDVHLGLNLASLEWKLSPIALRRPNVKLFHGQLFSTLWCTRLPH